MKATRKRKRKPAERPAMTPAEFRDWMRLYDLTAVRAAEALGMSSRMIKLYISPARPYPIPQTVAMAVYAHMRGYPGKRRKQ